MRRPRSLEIIASHDGNHKNSRTLQTTEKGRFRGSHRIGDRKGHKRFDTETLGRRIQESEIRFKIVLLFHYFIISGVQFFRGGRADGISQSSSRRLTSNLTLCTLYVGLWRPIVENQGLWLNMPETENRKQNPQILEPSILSDPNNCVSCVRCSSETV